MKIHTFERYRRRKKECAVSEKKNPYPPHGRSLEIPRGRGGGGLKVKIFEAKYEAKLEFPGGTGGAKPKNLPWGDIDIFWNCTMSE